MCWDQTRVAQAAAALELLNSGTGTDDGVAEEEAAPAFQDLAATSSQGAGYAASSSHDHQTASEQVVLGQKRRREPDESGGWGLKRPRFLEVATDPPPPDRSEEDSEAVRNLGNFLAAGAVLANEHLFGAGDKEGESSNFSEVYGRYLQPRAKALGVRFAKLLLREGNNLNTEAFDLFLKEYGKQISSGGKTLSEKFIEDGNFSSPRDKKSMEDAYRRHVPKMDEILSTSFTISFMQALYSQLAQDEDAQNDEELKLFIRKIPEVFSAFRMPTIFTGFSLPEGQRIYGINIVQHPTAVLKAAITSEYKTSEHTLIDYLRYMSNITVFEKALDKAEDEDNPTAFGAADVVRTVAAGAAGFSLKAFGAPLTASNIWKNTRIGTIAAERGHKPRDLLDLVPNKEDVLHSFSALYGNLTTDIKQGLDADEALFRRIDTYVASQRDFRALLKIMARAIMGLPVNDMETQDLEGSWSGVDVPGYRWPEDRFNRDIEEGMQITRGQLPIPTSPIRSRRWPTPSAFETLNANS